MAASLIREVSLHKISLNECKNYLKKLKINKFGLPKFREAQNLLKFLQIA